MVVRLVDVRRAVHGRDKIRDSVSVAVSNAAGKRYLFFSEGTNLQQGIAEWADSNKQPTGAFSLFSGDLQCAAYVVATPHAESNRIIEYGSPKSVSDPVRLLSGDGVYGSATSGEFLIHLHGALADSRGFTIGGHLNPADCVVGKRGLLARLFCGAGFKRGFDRETGFDIFEPAVSEN